MWSKKKSELRQRRFLHQRSHSSGASLNAGLSITSTNVSVSVDEPSSLTSLAIQQRSNVNNKTNDHVEHFHSTSNASLESRDIASPAGIHTSLDSSFSASSPLPSSFILPRIPQDTYSDAAKLGSSASEITGIAYSDNKTNSQSFILAGEQVKHDESRLTKIALRVTYGFTLFGFFCGSVYAGHLYVCLVVALVETLLFRELVSVRYSTYYHNIKDTIPLFRTTQWMWFVVAMFYNYGDFVHELVQNNPRLQQKMLPYVQYSGIVSFALYSTTLMVTITTLQREHLKFQINQLCWTVVVLCLTLGQLKYIMHNVINGLFWYVFPCCLVFCNDVMAYVCGMTMGRKFISRPFLSISPNKTWEGFIGAGVCTMIVAWNFSKFLAKYSWMTCPVNEFHIFPPSTLHCNPDPFFLPAQWIFPSQIFELLPRNIVRTIPGVVQICSTSIHVPMMQQQQNMGMVTSMFNDSNNVGSIIEWLEPCVSGYENQVHHHFEYRVTKDFYPIQVHALWLALFASVVAPFGGFLASAIKRAYGVKNFAALIPGHGGVMDRFDCQLVMALCTWVHYNTFIKIATVSVPKLSYLYSLLSPAEQEEFLRQISHKVSPSSSLR